jgi:cyclopropane-fatty-acyl-phospholipid synthase
MWEFYLAGSEGAFRFQNFVVFQLQLTRRVDGLPITRDYIQDVERTLPLGIETDTDRPRGIHARR